MRSKHKLSPSMSLTEFDNGYWYATELKNFAETIGIPAANKLRKDELEKAIKQFLRTGKIDLPTRRTREAGGGTLPRVSPRTRGLPESNTL